MSRQAINLFYVAEYKGANISWLLENLNFKGKAITVASEQGPENTIIDGNQTDSVVTFNLEEGNTSVLSGFTLQNGKADFGGGGIRISGYSPTITDNIITNNKASNGLGIEIYFGSPIIQGNTIKNNSRDGLTTIETILRLKSSEGVYRQS